MHQCSLVNVVKNRPPYVRRAALVDERTSWTKRGAVVGAAWVSEGPLVGSLSSHCRDDDRSQVDQPLVSELIMVIRYWMHCVCWTVYERVLLYVWGWFARVRCVVHIQSRSTITHSSSLTQRPYYPICLAKSLHRMSGGVQCLYHLIAADISMKIAHSIHTAGGTELGLDPCARQLTVWKLVPVWLR